MIYQSNSMKLSEELQKFFTVAEKRHSRGENTFMPVCIIDDHWHHLENKNAVEKETGFKFGHQSSKGSGVVDWIDEYEMSYGQLPKDWFYSKIDGLDRDSWNEYVETGEVHLSWDCTPILPTIPYNRKPKTKNQKLFAIPQMRDSCKLIGLY